MNNSNNPHCCGRVLLQNKRTTRLYGGGASDQRRHKTTLRIATVAGPCSYASFGYVDAGGLQIKSTFQSARLAPMSVACDEMPY